MTEATILMLADALNNKKTTMLRDVLKYYNEKAQKAASGQMDLFSEEVPSKEKFLKDVIEYVESGKKGEWDEREPGTRSEIREAGGEPQEGGQRELAPGGDEGGRGGTERGGLGEAIEEIRAEEAASKRRLRESERGGRIVDALDKVKEVAQATREARQDAEYGTPEHEEAERPFKEAIEDADKAFDALTDSELLELVENDEHIASAFESGGGLMVFSRTERRLRSLYMSREGGKLWDAVGEGENGGELPSGGGAVRGGFKMQEAAGKDKDRHVFTGVYHDGEEGVAVSTDTMIMVVSRKDYDPRHKGEVVYGSGKNETSEARPLGVGGYPNYRRVQPNGSRPVAGEVTLSGDALDALEGRLSAAVKMKGGKGESIAVKIGEGYCRVGLEKLYRFVRAMRHVGAREVKLIGEAMIVAEGRDGRVLLMVQDPASHMAHEVKYRTELGREAEASTPTTETPEAREAEAEYGGEVRYDPQGNPIDKEGKLIIEQVDGIDEITDEDFIEPTRSIALPALPEGVQRVLSTNGKRVIIKKNILERNAFRHGELTPEMSRAILREALYNPTLYGKNQPLSRPNNWIVISVSDGKGNNKLVVVEVNDRKENIEIIHWYEVNEKGLEKIRRQAEREDGQLLILPSESSEEAGALSGPTSDKPSEGKVSENNSNAQEGTAEYQGNRIKFRSIFE